MPTAVASKLFMNWTGVTVTYGTVPTVVSIDEVTDISVDKQSETKKWYADAAAFPKALATKNKTRKLTIKGGNITALQSIPEDTPCTIAANLNDLKNGTGTGALVLSLVNAVVTNNPFSGKNNDFGTGDLTFEAYSTDGTTDPLTITITP